MGSNSSKPLKPPKPSKRGHSRSKSEGATPSRPPDNILNGTARADPGPLSPTTGTTDRDTAVTPSEAGSSSSKPQRRMSRRLSLTRRVANEYAKEDKKPPPSSSNRESKARERANSLPGSVRAARRMSGSSAAPKPMDLLCGKCFRQMPYGANAKLCLQDRKTFCPPCVEDDMLNHDTSHKLVRLAVKRPESHPVTGDIACNICHTAEPAGPSYASASCLTCDTWADSFEICAHCLTEPDPNRGWNILKEHGETHLPAETVWAYYQPPGEVEPERFMYERFGLVAKKNHIIGGSRRESGSAGVFMGKYGHVRSQVYAPNVPF